MIFGSYIGMTVIIFYKKNSEFTHGVEQLFGTNYQNSTEN